MTTYDTYTVYNLDVWGNEEEGYDLNAWYNAGVIEVPAGADDTQIIAELKAQDYLSPDADVYADDYGTEMIHIYSSSDHMPLYNLEPTDNQ